MLRPRRLNTPNFRSSALTVSMFPSESRYTAQMRLSMVSLMSFVVCNRVSAAQGNLPPLASASSISSFTLLYRLKVSCGLRGWRGLSARDTGRGGSYSSWDPLRCRRVYRVGTCSRPRRASFEGRCMRGNGYSRRPIYECGHRAEDTSSQDTRTGNRRRSYRVERPRETPCARTTPPGRHSNSSRACATRRATAFAEMCTPTWIPRCSTTSTLHRWSRRWTAPSRGS